ncbi:MAG: ribosomal-processing cysteine protease Prp [Ruminococcaceae bacterium]|nr:ribosomal-processing cysteine protease Prp [Oscillospiraceae bacterium]
MTRCEFFRENERITGFSVSGHSGYAESGADIVCAAISAVVTMVEATINDVCGAKAKVRVKEEDARITLTLPASCEEEDTIQAVLAGMMVYLIDLRDQYPDFIEVLEV